jgi:hypothetical protein
LLNATPWALPVTFILGVIGVCLILARTGMSEKGWEWVDLLWILSSAVTLYFLATGMLFDGVRTSAQIEQDNYLSHVRRGRERANLNLATFCVGPTRRVLVVESDEERRFCGLNDFAFRSFTWTAQIFEGSSGIRIETAFERLPDEVVTGPGGQDAVVANILWQQVRDEIGYQNASARKLKAYRDDSAFLSSTRPARIGWMYIFALVIALRIAKPLFTLWIAPWRSRKARGKTGQPPF